MQTDKIEIGHVIERTVSTGMRAGRALLLPVIVLIGGSTFVTQYLVGYDPANPTALMGSPAYWLAMFAATLIGAFGQALIVHVALCDLYRRPVSVRASFGVALDLMLPVAGVSLLSLLVVLVGLLALIVPGIIAGLALTVVLPAMIEERLGVVESMKRSNVLTRGSRLRILALILIGTMIYGGVAALFGARFALAGEESGIPPTLLLGIDAILSALGALLIGAFTAAIYVDLRAVKEASGGDGVAGIFE